MAHWKIKHYASGTTIYICSNCGKAYDFLYNPNIYREDACPLCKERINQEVNEYECGVV